MEYPTVTAAKLKLEVLAKVHPKGPPSDAVWTGKHQSPLADNIDACRTVVKVSLKSKNLDLEEAFEMLELALRTLPIK